MVTAPGMAAASAEAPPVPGDRPGQLSLEVERPARLEGDGRRLLRALEGGHPGGVRVGRAPGVEERLRPDAGRPLRERNIARGTGSLQRQLRLDQLRRRVARLAQPRRLPEVNVRLFAREGAPSPLPRPRAGPDGKPSRASSTRRGPKGPTPRTPPEVSTAVDDLPPTAASGTSAYQARSGDQPSQDGRSGDSADGSSVPPPPTSPSFGTRNAATAPEYPIRLL